MSKLVAMWTGPRRYGITILSHVSSSCTNETSIFVSISIISIQLEVISIVALVTSCPTISCNMSRLVTIIAYLTSIVTAVSPIVISMYWMTIIISTWVGGSSSQ